MGVAPGAAEPQRSLADMGIDSMQQVAHAGPAHALALHSTHTNLPACRRMHTEGRMPGTCKRGPARCSACVRQDASGCGRLALAIVQPATVGRRRAAPRPHACLPLFLPHARASLGPAALRLTRGAAAQVEVRALVQRALGRPFPLEQARAPAHAVGVRSSAAYVPCEYALPLSPRHV